METSSESTTRYLLGEMEAEERNAFELAFFRDDEAFELVQAAEAELLDSYVRGELPRRRARAFEEFLAERPELAERLSFAQALAVEADRRQESEITARRRSGRQFMALAASLVATLAVAMLASWLLWRDSGLRQTLEQTELARLELQEELAETRKTLETSAEQRQQLDLQLDQTRTALESAEQRLAETRAPAPPAVQQESLLFLDVHRGTAASQSLEIELQPNTPVLELLLLVDSPVTPTRLGTTLRRTDAADSPWMQVTAGLAWQPRGSGFSVTLSVPAALLKSGTYRLDLADLGTSNRAKRRELGTYELVIKTAD